MIGLTTLLSRLFAKIETATVPVVTKAHANTQHVKIYVPKRSSLVLICYFQFKRLLEEKRTSFK